MLKFYPDVLLTESGYWVWQGCSRHYMDVIAIRFFDNVFAVFLDDLDEDMVKPWYERFYSEFEVDILETILNGSEHCRFRITKK